MAELTKLVVVTVDELRTLIREAVREALAGAREEPFESLDLQAAAKFAGVHPRTLTKFVRLNVLRTHRIGRLYRFRRADLQAWLEGSHGA